jgi:hypothetical protein
LAWVNKPFGREGVAGIHGITRQLGGASLCEAVDTSGGLEVFASKIRTATKVRRPINSLSMIHAAFLALFVKPFDTRDYASDGSSCAPSAVAFAPLHKYFRPAQIPAWAVPAKRETHNHKRVLSREVAQSVARWSTAGDHPSLLQEIRRSLAL